MRGITSEFPVRYAHCRCVCVYVCLTSSSHEFLGIKEGFILFLQRAQHASFTYITTYAYNNNIKPIRCVFGRGRELCVWRVYNYICDTMGSLVLHISCKGHIFMYMCVLMCVRRYVFFFGVRIDLAWTRVTPSKRVTKVWGWSFTRSSLTSGHRKYPPQSALYLSDFLSRSFCFLALHLRLKIEEEYVIQWRVPARACSRFNDIYN